MSLSQSLSLNITSAINTLNSQIGVLETMETQITPTLLYTDSQFFEYGKQISATKVLQDQANDAVTNNLVDPSDSATIAALETRLENVEAAYITAMVARAPNLWT